MAFLTKLMAALLFSNVALGKEPAFHTLSKPYLHVDGVTHGRLEHFELQLVLEVTRHG